MASAFALSVAKNLPSGSCTLKDGGRIDMVRFLGCLCKLINGHIQRDTTIQFCPAQTSASNL